MFESRQAQKFLKISSDHLHHWVNVKQLVKPAKAGKGRGRNKFSFENLVELAIVKELAMFGIELNAIKSIISGDRISYVRDDFDESAQAVLLKGKPPYKLYCEHKDKIERGGLWIEVFRDERGYQWLYRSEDGKVGTIDYIIERNLGGGGSYTPNPPYTILIIGIAKIIKWLEVLVQVDQGDDEHMKREYFPIK